MSDGRIAGVWEYAIKRNRAEIAVTPFESLSKPARTGIADEAERLGKFLGSEISLKIE